MATQLKNEPLRNKTTIRIGGPADTLVYPENKAQLAGWLKTGEVSFILGGGSNVLVADAGVRGVTLRLARGFSDVAITRRRDGTVTVVAQAGVGLTRLAGLLMKEAVAGFEFAHGIPGLLGGALVMNAGVKDGEMKDVVESVTAVAAGGSEKIIGRDDCGFAYRSSAFPRGAALVEATLRLRAGEREAIHEKMKRNQTERKTKQPLEYPSAGSVWKNPPGDHAGRLIEAAGLKGARVGGAEVSVKHANFIVNRGGATAAQVLALMNRVEKEVFDSSGVALEREIKLIGEFNG